MRNAAASVLAQTLAGIAVLSGSFPLYTGQCYNLDAQEGLGSDLVICNGSSLDCQRFRLLHVVSSSSCLLWPPGQIALLH